MKKTSCGILALSAEEEVLLCHATGGRYWDIPKGGGKEGESGAQTAVREAFEECGLRLNPVDLHELGRFAYRPGKDLLLYAVLLERIDPNLCVCSSHYRTPWGQLRPEMNAFRWTSFDEVPERCAKSLSAVLTQGISLPKVLAQLLSVGPPVRPGTADASGRC